MVNVILSIYAKMFARPKFRRVNTILFLLGLKGLGVLNYENDKVSGEKYLIRKVLPSVIKNDNPVFFDIGADVGDYAVSLSGSFPNATIYAFEPHPKNYSRLKDKVSSGRVKCYDFALGEARGRLTLYDRADYDGSSHASLYEPVITEIHKQDTVAFPVSVETLDDFSEREKITYIDFMKIDTEGHELAVLRGAAKLLENGKIGCIQFEFNEMNIVSRVFFRDFRKILHNYELYRLLPGGLLHLDDHPLSTELFAYQNIVALNKKLPIQASVLYRLSQMSGLNFR